MNLLLSLSFVTLLTVFNQTAFGQSKIDHHFEDFFYSKEISSRHCGENISKFMKYLGNKNLNIHDQVTIVYMESPQHAWSFGDVMAVKARWGKVHSNGIMHSNFYFHVFAIYDGRAFDFTFEDRPTILNVNDYLYAMYVPDEGFMPYGSSFSTRGLGATYKPSYAIEELKQSVFTLMKTDKFGNFTVVGSKLKFKEVFKDFE